MTLEQQGKKQNPVQTVQLFAKVVMAYATCFTSSAYFLSFLVSFDRFFTRKPSPLEGEGFLYPLSVRLYAPGHR